MRFVCDEGVERQVVEALRAGGHEIVYIAELSPGISDDEVLELANRNKALLVTSDKDFGELIFRQGRFHSGVVLLRLHGVPPWEKGELVSAGVAEHGAEFRGAFCVVEPGRIRIRRGDPQ